MKILIVKTSSLGDIIHAFPVIDYLKERFPSAQIDWVVEKPFSELVQGHPLITRTLCVETKKWRKHPFALRKEISSFCSVLRETLYDFAFDLQGNFKSGLIMSRVRANKKIGFGWKTAAEKPNCLFTHIKFNPSAELSVREENLFLVQTIFSDARPFEPKPLKLKITPDQEQQLLHYIKKESQIMVCPGSAWPNKQTSLEALIGFLSQLKASRSCSFVLAWGSEQEKLEAQAIAAHFEDSLLLEKLPLPLLQNLMQKMSLVIAMDSLPLHLAGTTGVPVYGIFGPSSAVKYMPPGNFFCQGTCPYGRTFNRRCPVLRSCPTGLCIKGLSGSQLFRNCNIR